MEYNKINIYYEIIDANPVVLKHKIPLIEFFKKISFHFYLFFTLFYFVLSGKLKIKQIFTKTEITNGREQNALSEFENIGDLKETEIFSKKDKVLKTISTYYSRRASKKILKDLIDQGQKIDLNKFSDSFSIKKRVEYIDSESSENKVIILINYSILAKRINKLFSKINL